MFGDITDILTDLGTTQVLIETPEYQEVSYGGRLPVYNTQGEGFPLIAEPTFALERGGDDPNKTFEVVIENLTSAFNGDRYNAQKIGVEASHRMYIDKIYNEALEITEADRVKETSTGKYYKVAYVDPPMNLNKFLEVYLMEDDNYGSQSN